MENELPFVTELKKKLFLNSLKEAGITMRNDMFSFQKSGFSNEDLMKMYISEKEEYKRFCEYEKDDDQLPRKAEKKDALAEYILSPGKKVETFGLLNDVWASPMGISAGMQPLNGIKIGRLSPAWPLDTMVRDIEGRSIGRLNPLRNDMTLSSPW